MLVELFKPDPKRIAAIGLGGGSLPKYCYAALLRSSIVVAEIHPEALAMRELFHIPPDDERFEVRCEDGADFVRAGGGSLDVLLVDGFDAGGQSAQLCTQAFYDDCYRCLAPGGIAVINVAVENPDLERSIARIRRSFVDAVVVESEDRTNRIAFAGKDDVLRVPFEQLGTRLDELEKHHPVGLRDTLQRIRCEQYGALSILPRASGPRHVPGDPGGPLAHGSNLDARAADSNFPMSRAKIHRLSTVSSIPILTPWHS